MGGKRRLSRKRLFGDPRLFGREEEAAGDYAVPIGRCDDDGTTGRVGGDEKRSREVGSNRRPDA